MLNQIIESLRLKKTSKIIESNCLPSTAKSTIFPHVTSTRLLNGFRNGDTTTVLCSLCQGLTTLFVKKFFAISNLNCPWHNLRPFPLISFPLYLGEVPTQLQASFQGVVESDKVSHELPFLHTKHSKLPQLFIRFVLQILLQLCCPGLDMLQHTNIFEA